jgi:hypothetical protein
LSNFPVALSNWQLEQVLEYASAAHEAANALPAKTKDSKTIVFRIKDWFAMGGVRRKRIKGKLRGGKIKSRKFQKKNLFERDFYLYILRHSDAHDLAKRPFVACYINYSLVNPHFPVLVGVRAVAAGRAARAYVQSAGGKRHRAFYFYPSGFCDFHYLLADLFKVFRSLSDQFYSRFSQIYTRF